MPPAVPAPSAGLVRCSRPPLSRAAGRRRQSARVPPTHDRCGGWHWWKGRPCHFLRANSGHH
eukprot:12283416-Alexandrium_andersonii.AAC.1